MLSVQLNYSFKQALFGSCSVVAFSLLPGLNAQAAPDSLPPIVTDASLLQTTAATAIQPRGSVGYNSSGSGYEGFAHLDGFFPLWQTVGKDLGFLNSRLNVDENGNLGGTVLLGYRNVSESGNWIRGGYVAYDQRNTDHNTFHQVGFGLEQLGEVDLRFNAYLPIGQTRQASVNTGLQLRDLYFSGHQLNLVIEQQQIYEAAAKGFDLEAGTQLARLGSGALKGYAGVYYYDPPNAGGIWGYRLRLNANPQGNLNLGLNFQSDPLFGSQVSFRVGTSWGKRQQRQTEEPTWTRLGESVERTGTIALDTQVEAAFSGTIAATNPETGEAWYFLHVNPSDSSGDGQFESPYATAEEALQAASALTSVANRNTTIYVQDTASSIINTQVPDNVRFWSTGPLQQLDTNEFSRVTLPLSNSGVYPLLTRTVNMGNGSHLAGFTITPPTGDSGVFGREVGDIIVRENRITTSGENATGVQLLDGDGSLLVTLNEVTTTGNSAHGVAITQLQAATVTEATITSNSIETQGVDASGISTFTRGAGAQVNQLEVTNNTIRATNDQGKGVFAFADAGSTIQDLALTRNTIATTGTEGQGISAIARNATIGTITATSNQISTIGTEAQAISLFSSYQGQLNQTTITGNTITTQGFESAGVAAFAITGGTLTQATLTNNQVTTQGQDAVGVLAFAAGCDDGMGDPTDSTVNPVCDGSNTILASSQLGTATIANNTVNTEQTGASGVLAFAVRTGSLNTATITGNTVTTGGAGQTQANNPYLEYAGGIMAFAANASQLNTATITGNTITTEQDNANGLAVFSVRDEPTTTTPPTYQYGASSLTTATVTNNVVTTEGQRSHALSAFATHSSSFGTATLSNNQLTTQGDESHAVSSFASNSRNFDTTTITNNNLTTGGQDSSGVNVAADNNATLTTATITGNTSNTTGVQGYGVLVRSSNNSTVGTATVQSNQIQTTNTQAHGVTVAVQTNNAVLTTGLVNNNTVTTSGLGARGLGVLTLNTGDLKDISLSDNTITTSGGCTQDSNNVVFCADGVNFVGLNGKLSNTAAIERNQIRTSGLGAAGISTSAIGGTADINTFRISHNQVTTTGEQYQPNSTNPNNALGINVSALTGATIAQADILDNTITTTGTSAHGVQVLAAPGVITTTTIARNVVSTAGEGADGMIAQSSNANSKLTTLTLESNQINAPGAEAFGIFSLATSDGQINSAAFVDNAIAAAGKDSVFFLTSPQDPTFTDTLFCVARFTGNTSQTNSGQDLQAIQNVGSLTLVDFSNWNTVNTGFDAVSVSPGADTTATACP